jgi:hypothetical protein
LTAIDNIVSNLQKIKVDKDKIVLDIIEINEVFTIDLNRKQLMSGIDGKGNEIVPEYSDFTFDVKIRVGQPADRVTLKDTGDFHASIFIDYGTKYIYFDAKDSKTNDLIEKYGGSILGLTDKSIDLLKNKIKSDLRTKIQSYL